MKNTWFITGVSRGFGKVLTEELLSLGRVVIGTTRSGESIIKHPNFHCLKLDVTDAQSVQACYAQALALVKKIDVVVNNAGFGIVGSVEEVSLSEAKVIFETNYFGTLNVIHAALPSLRAQKSGHIVNFSSIGGFLGIPGFGIYNSAKFAVEGMSEALAGELAPLGIDVTIVEPGAYRTDFLSESSLIRAEKTIPDYIESSGKTRQYAEERNGAQPGDPLAAMQLLIHAIDEKEASLRLPLGGDCIDRMRLKIASVQKDLDRWEVSSRKTSL